MKAEDFFLPVSTFLSDQLEGDAFARWTKDDLFFAFKWAVRWLAAAKPQYFVKPFTVNLIEGVWQPLPTECQSITDTIDNLRKISHRSMQLVDRDRVHVSVGRNRSEYHPREYVHDFDRDPNSFFIYPPCPPWATGKEFKILGTYYPNPADPQEDLVINPTMDGVVESLMIYYIGTGENESATLKEVARMRFEDVQVALGLNDRDVQRYDAQATAQQNEDKL